MEMQTICAECGGVFAVENTIHYGNVDVCSGCKPAFMQKLAEGASVKTGEFQYGGFWIRFLALFVDSLISLAANIIIAVAAGFNLMQAIGLQPKGTLTFTYAWAGIVWVLGALYEILMVRQYGATLGKMACGLKVIREDGSPLSLGLSTGRFFAKYLSFLTLYIGFIIAAFDIEKRALHDRICSTRVIRK